MSMVNHSPTHGFDTEPGGDLGRRVERRGVYRENRGMVSEAVGGGQELYDVLIIGGGPAGALAGLMLARKGRRAVILEKTKFPRFHVGESFLPATLDLI